MSKFNSVVNYEHATIQRLDFINYKDHKAFLIEIFSIKETRNLMHMSNVQHTHTRTHARARTQRKLNLISRGINYFMHRR